MSTVELLPSDKVEVVFENRLRIIYSLLDMDTNFVDVGVNYGQHFICASKRFKKEFRGSCVGYEPSDDCFEYIKNQKLPSTIKKLGVSKNSGISKYIYIEGLNGAWSALDEVLPNVPKGHSKTITEIQTVTLDEEFINKDIDFIKIDIEGGEYNALLGAKNLMVQSSPLIVIEHAGVMNGDALKYNFNDYLNLFPKEYTILGIDFKKYKEANYYDGMPWMQIAVPKRFKKYINFIKSICFNKKNHLLIMNDHFIDGVHIVNGIKSTNNNFNIFSRVKVDNNFLEIPFSSKLRYLFI